MAEKIGRKKIAADSSEHLFAERLQKQMKKHGNMTQKELAEKIGVSKDIVWDWVNGYKFPEYKNLSKLCDLFSPCSVDYFYGKIEEPNYDLKFISEYTGLSPERIQYLHNMKENLPENIAELDSLLKMNAFWNMLVAIHGAKEAYKTSDYPRNTDNRLNAYEAFSELMKGIQRVNNGRDPVLDEIFRQIKNRPE